jgi:REP element-mobilizing transposase RayT
MFHLDDDYARFMWQLAEALDRDEVILFAYCLMPNHYDLFVETPRGNLDEFVHRLHTAYSMYHRYKYSRPGNLVQPRYKAPLIESDDYIIRLTRYIHLNAVKVGAMRKLPVETKLTELNAYRWSSYRGYVQKRAEQEIIDYRWRELVAGRTDTEMRRRYRVYVESMVDGKDELLLSAMDASSYAIGDEEYVRKVEEDLREREASGGVTADVLVPLEEAVEADRIDRAVSEVFGCTGEDLSLHGRAVGEAKSVALELACRYGRLNHRQAGQRYGGISGAAVGQQRRKLRERRDDDPAFAERLQRTEKRLRAAVFG